MEGVKWPPVLVGEHAVLAALLAELETTQWLPQAVIEQRQAQQLAVLIRHHVRHSPLFAERFKAAGRRAEKSDSIARLRAIAPLTRHELQSAGPSFFAKQVPRSHMPAAMVQSSGSTGEPVEIRKTGLNQLFFMAFGFRDNFWYRRNFLSRMMSIRSHVEAIGEFDEWAAPTSDLFESGPSQDIPIETDIERQARLIEKFKPEILLLYPNNLSALLTLWETGRFKIPPLKHIKTIAETVSEDLRVRTMKITGLRIEDVYSSEEVGTIAIQCPESGLYHIMAEALIVEVIDDKGEPCKEGQIGRVVVTDLHNFASPMIRYVNGDHAEVGGTCSCGRGLPTLRRILGRERNLLVKPDGTRHWPPIGLIKFQEVAPVRQFQFIQHSVDRIELKIATDEEISAADAEGVCRLAREALGTEFNIELVQSRERLPSGRNGKYEEFICRVT